MTNKEKELTEKCLNIAEPTAEPMPEMPDIHKSPSTSHRSNGHAERTPGSDTLSSAVSRKDNGKGESETRKYISSKEAFQALKREFYVKSAERKRGSLSGLFHDDVDPCSVVASSSPSPPAFSPPPADSSVAVERLDSLSKHFQTKSGQISCVADEDDSDENEDVAEIMEYIRPLFIDGGNIEHQAPMQMKQGEYPSNDASSSSLTF
jgi:hypothetical protein